MPRALDIVIGYLIFFGGIAVLCYVGYRIVKRSLDPVRLLIRVGISLFLIGICVLILRNVDPPGWPIVVVPFAIVLGIMWTKSVVDTVFLPLFGFFTGDSQEIEAQPLYSSAEAKRTRGLYQEAIKDAEKQLEHFPNDFTGIMLIASIRAENLGDLPGARGIVEELLATTSLPPQRLAGALQIMADWELKYALDPEAARRCLERISKALPNTPWAQLSKERADRLPTIEGLTELKEPRVIDLPKGIRNIGLLNKLPVETMEPDPGVLANSYLKRLEKYPLDNEIREKLAMIYAEKFHRVDLACDQLEQMIAQPHHTPKRIAYWLNLMATIHIREGKDLASAEKALRRIIESFPQLAPAEMAMTRLSMLRKELAVNKVTEVKKMGNYKKNLGLQENGPD